MIAGNVNHPGAFTQQVEYFFYDLQVGSREIPFGKLPAINNVPVKDQQAWGYAPEIVYYFTGMASVSTEMEIREYGYVEVSFMQSILVFQNT